MTSFPETVEDHFAALGRFGFKMSEPGPYTVTFWRHDVQISVVFDPRGALDLEIATTGPTAQRVTVTEVEGAEGRRSLFLRLDRLDASVARLAALLFGKYEAVLRGDMNQIQELAKRDALASRELNWNASNAPTIRAADDAWKRHDYPNVARLLGPLEAGLGPTELRRLVHARKQSM
ncbi:MAG: hypothetical protein V4850_33080 [Myxococcota bacterium]